MKSYKQFIKESKTDIHSICNQYNITNYTINPDGSIDVEGNVYLDYQIINNASLTKLPLRFRNVSGHFDCSNNELTSLEGGPQSVGGHFDYRNNKLVNLNGFPEFFENEVYLSNNPVQEIYDLFGTFKCINWLNEFDVIQGNSVIMDRLEEVYHQLGMEMPENIKLKNYEII